MKVIACTTPAAIVTLVALVVIVCLPQGHGLSPSRQQTTTTITCPRRVGDENIRILPIVTRRLAVAGLLLSPFVIAALHPAAVAAFDNGIPDMEMYKNKTKNPGIQPSSLGLQSNGKLAICNDGLNCFSTSGDEAHMLELWKPPQQKAADSNGNSNAIMGDLLETIKAYPPGQNRVDRGGFKIVTTSADYLYVQFESMKHGFIDDVEFSVTQTQSGNNKEVVQVRSSSRIGNLDLGVNAKRLNWISAELRAKGWTAPEITKEDYPDYYNTLVFTFDDYIRSVLSPLDCPVPSQPITCNDPSPSK
jgi:uncharacterized protein (DUF1499 family)